MNETTPLADVLHDSRKYNKITHLEKTYMSKVAGTGSIFGRLRVFFPILYKDQEQGLSKTFAWLHTYLKIDNLNSSSPEQNSRHFTDGIFKCIFMNENVCILIQISLKFVPEGLTISQNWFM